MTQTQHTNESKNMTTATEIWVAIGTTDEVCTCDCCGRENLKKTVRMGIKDIESGDINEAGFFGTSCASQRSGLTAASITKQANAADRKARQEAAYAKQQESSRWVGNFIEFCESVAGKGSHGLNLEAMGGFRAAMGQFDAVAK